MNTASLLNSILVVVLVMNLFALGASRVHAVIRIVAAQGAILGLIPLLAPQHLTIPALLMVVAAMGIKGAVIPGIMMRALRDAAIKREVEPLIGRLPSTILGAAATLLALLFAGQLPLASPHDVVLLVPASMATVLVGFILLTTRYTALNQIVGYLVLENSYLPAELFPGILGLSLEENLYNIMVKEYGMRLDYARTEIGAVLPTADERHLLKINEHCPCLWVEGLVYNKSGRTVEFARALCRGDKYRFVCSIGQYVCSNLHDEAPGKALPR